LRGFPVEKDLIVDIEPAIARLSRVKPYLISDSDEPRINKRDAERSKSFRRCIECFACIAAVTPHGRTHSAPLDPLGIVKLARFDTDPRDIEDRRRIARELGIGTYTAAELRRATAVCPKHINIIEAYNQLAQGTEEAK
jgi:succinate dehydrogenase/fumarate reductase iron-sulfur protein